MTVVNAPPKKDHENAVDEFLQADADYKALQENMLSGDFIIEYGSQGTKDYLVQQWKQLVVRLKVLQEDRNSKLKTAQHAMRAVVQLTETQWRGRDGKSTEMTYGPFKVTSVTHRGFDPESLFNLARNRGLLERMLELTAVDDTGKVVPLIKQEWDINYEKLMGWLKVNGMSDVIEGAYDEKEKTPQVKGPKPIAFLGDEIKS